MTEKKNSKFLAALFASAMMFVQPAQANDITVNDEASLNSALESSTYTRIFFENEIDVTSPAGLPLWSGKTLIGGQNGGMNILNLGNNMSYFLWNTENYFNLEYIKFKNANFTVEQPITVTSLNCEYDGSGNTQDSSLYTISGSMASFTSNGKNTFSNYTKAQNGGVFNIGDSRYADNNELHLNSDTFNNNASSEKGGAIAYMGYENVTSDHNILEVAETSFNKNKSANGGAIYSQYAYEMDIKSTVNGSSSFKNNEATKNGGAIYNIGSKTFNIAGYNNEENKVIFGGNTAGSKGGAIYNENSNLTISNSIFEGNQTTGDDGGAIYNNSRESETLKISDSTFTTNQSKGFGGAISMASGNLELENTDFAGNSGYGGGALYVEQSVNKTTITGGTFKDNFTRTGNGGVIYDESYGTSTVSDAKFEKNSANQISGVGGAIYKSNGTLNIQNTEFNINSAQKGGAIYNYSDIFASNDVNFTGNFSETSGGAIHNTSNSTSTITGGTFEGNEAINGDGGAIFDESYNATTISNATFKNNMATEACGGAIYRQNGSLDLTSTNFIGNSAKRGGAIYNDAETVNIKANGKDVLFDGNKATELEATSDIYNSGTVKLVADKTHSITFNGNIGTDENETGTINISSSNTGTINFNGIVSYQDITLNNGTLVLGQNATAGRTNYFDNVSLTLNGGTLSSANNFIDNITIDNLNVVGDANFTFDISLDSEEGTSDFFQIGSYLGNTKLNIGKLNIIAGMADGQTRSKIKFSNQARLDTIIDEINKRISFGGVNYDVYLENNILTILREGTAIDFAHAVIDTYDEKTYTIGDIDEIVSWVNDDNTLKGKKLTLNGGSNGKVIKGETSSVYGITLGVDADGNAQEFVVEDVASYENFYVGIRNNGGKVTIKNSTLQNNKSTAEQKGDIYFYGGAIHNDAGTVDLEDSNFIKNSTTTKGGAIYSKSGTLNIKNTNFTENTSIDGGALYLTEGASATIEGGTVEGNESTSNGGAIYNDGAGTIKITGTEFKNNKSERQEGGAIYNDGGNLEISDATFSDNNCSNNGGAIYHGSGIANIDNTKFTNNKGDYGSGAIYNGDAATMTVSNSSFEGNISSSFGGAIKNDGSLTIENTSFKNNTSNYGGGAIYNYSNTTMTISNSSFEDNKTTQGYGGAIANFGDLTIENTNFINNTSNTNGGAIYNSNNLTIKATGGNEVEFTGNKSTSNEHTNGIYNTGDLYLTADDTSSITFNDNIGGDIGGSKYGIHITEDNTGTINFNNKITNQSIYLNGGTLALGQNASVRTTDYFENVDLTLNGGTFSMKNDRIDEVTVYNLTIGDNNPNFTFDVNISNIAGESDKIIVDNAFNKNENGSLKLGPLNILAGMADDQIRSDMEFSNKDINAVIDEVNKHITYDGITYDIYAEGNKIIVMRGGYAIDFAHAILDDTNLERTYQIPNAGENVTDWLNGDNKLVGSKFQLLGGNGTKTIQGNNIEGIIIGTYNGSPQNYIVKDVDSYTGFYSAIINNGGIVDLTNTTFNNNNSPYDGGAIQNNSGTVNINNGVIFKGNNATYNGGAIYNGENGTINFNLTNAGDSVKFENNVNGDIYNKGTVNFNGEGEVSFTSGIFGTVNSSMVNNGAKVSLSSTKSDYEGEYIQNSGTTTFLNQFKKGTTIINGGNVNWLADCDYWTKVTFNGGKLYIGSAGNNATFDVGTNSSIDGAELVYINDGSTLFIENDTKIGNIQGNGNFKVKYRTITIDDNSTLDSDLKMNISASTVKFEGTSERQTGSILGTLAQDTVTLDNAQYLFENTTITPDITVDGTKLSGVWTTGDVNLNGQITSTGGGYVINEGNLTVSGNQSGFKGSFYQDRENTKTTINDSSYMFGGEKNIEKSELIVSGGTVNYDKVHLGKDAKLSQTITSTDVGILNSNVLNFTSSGAKAEFKSSGVVGNISLGAGIGNGQDNTISFDNVKVSLADKNYVGKTLYDFKNSEINLIDGTGNLNNYVFDNIKTDNTKLDFNLKINRDDGNGNTISTDNVTVNTSDTQKFELGDVYITGEENGQLGDYTATGNLVDGNAELNEPSSPIWAGATTSWTYKIVLDGKQKVKMAIEDYSDENTLNDMNKQGGKRFFQFSEGDTRDYHIGSSLEETASGEFLVRGDNKNVISGAIVDQTGALTGANGDLFKLNNETKLTIDNVTIKDATQVAKVNNDNAELNIQNTDIVKNGGSTASTLDVVKGTANISSSTFSENTTVANGGAITSSGVLNIDNTKFNKNEATGTTNPATEGFGGAINSNGTTTIANSEFTENTATISGGAIANSGTLNIDNTKFTKNEAKRTYATGTTTAFGQGGAIAHEKGTTTIKNSIFNENKAYKHGGAIYAEEGTLTLENTEFTGNKTSYSGGAISTGEDENKDITIDIKNSSFKNNTANEFAGAIYNYKGKLNIADSTFENNSTMDNAAGAIYNNSGDATITNTDFIGNTALGDGSMYGGSAGGAISNTGNLNIIGGKFDSNKGYLGGALYNNGNASILDTLFIGNEATSTLNPNANGGAIKNASNLTITDASFSSNKASNGRGGAIYNTDDEGAVATVNIIAENKDVIFNDNVDSTGSNAIYNEATGSGVEINLNAGSSDIVFEDAIDGGTANIDKQIININKDNGSAPTEGYVEFDNVVKNNTVNLYNGILTFDDAGNFDSSVLFNVNGGSVDLVNDNIQNVNLGNVTLNSDMNLYIDGNFETKELDTITADGFTSNGNFINIAGINLLEPTEEKAFRISPLGTFADETVKNSVAAAIKYTGGEIVYSPIYKYNVSYDPTSAMLNFGLQSDNPSENFNPAVLSSSVGAQLGSYLNQINIYEQAFSNMDLMMIMTKEQRNAMKYANKYASQGTGNGGVITFSPNQIPEQNKGMWFRPYTTFENVNLSKGPNVKNIAYGSLFGGDTGLIELGHGWDMVASAYAAYNGSNQNYDGVTITQNGGSLGVSGAWYKGNFYTGLTANVGANAAEASSMYGKEDYTMLATGIASKSGYNFELANGRFIIQPNFLMSYTFVNTFDYTNAAGVKITSDPLNAIQIAPGVKLIGNLKNGWQPYLGVQMIWNIMDRTKFYANNVSLPNMSVDPYVQYGVGVQKKIGERFTGFGQAMLRNGGRNGVALQFGFRWSL